MRKIILCAMVVLCMAPATLQAGWGWGQKKPDEKKAPRVEQKQKQKVTAKTAKEKSPEELQVAVLKQREALVAQNKAFQQAIHERQMGELKAKLAKNTKLTVAQKDEILASREKQYTETRAYEEKRRVENADFFQKLTSDPKMTEDQKREAIRAHFQSQRPGNQAFRQQQKNKSAAEREKIGSEVSPSAKTAAQ
jgi:hypothetical protein